MIKSKIIKHIKNKEIIDLILHKQTEYLSIPKNQFVGINLDPMSIDYLVSMLALINLGHSVVLLHPKWSKIFHTECYDCISYNYLIEKNNILKLSNNNTPKYQSIICFTSGSSGPIKGIVHNEDTILESIDSYKKTFIINECDSSLIVLPQNHIAGLLGSLRALIIGTKLYFCDNKFSLLENIEKTKPKIISMVPNQINSIKGTNNLILKKLKYLFVGGDFLSNNLREWLITNKVNAINVYGSTETCAMSLYLPILNEKLFKIMNNRLISIFNKNIKIEGSAIFKGHYRNNTYIKNKDNCFLSNDMAQIRKDRVKLLGRSDLIFKVKGENVNPVMLEQKIKNIFNLEEVKILPIYVNSNNKIIALIRPFNKLLSYYIDESNKLLSSFNRPSSFYDLNMVSRDSIKITTNSISNITKPIKIFFVHGFMGQASDFDEIVKNFPNNYICKSINIPFHKNGKSNFKSKDESYHYIKEEIVNFSPDILIGYSMGGRIIINLLVNYNLLKYLDKKIKLVIESSNLGMIKNLDLKKDFEDKLFLKLNSPRDFYKSWFSLNIFSGINENINFEELINKRVKNFNKKNYLLALNHFSVVNNSISFENLETIKVPLLFLYGENDLKYEEVAFKVYKLITNSKIVKIRNSSHNIHFMNPKDYIKNIIKFTL